MNFYATSTRNQAVAVVELKMVKRERVNSFCQWVITVSAVIMCILILGMLGVVLTNILVSRRMLPL